MYLIYYVLVIFQDSNELSNESDPDSSTSSDNEFSDRETQKKNQKQRAKNRNQVVGSTLNKDKVRQSGRSTKGKMPSRYCTTSSSEGTKRKRLQKSQSVKKQKSNNQKGKTYIIIYINYMLHLKKLCILNFYFSLIDLHF